MKGISYKKTDAHLRGRFAVNTPEEYDQIISAGQKAELSEFFVLSTCNRTEIYGFSGNPSQLDEVLCSATPGSVEEFQQIAYSYQGEEAIRHLFKVATGLDSQILGDYEIIGQLRKALRCFKDNGFVGARLERMSNEVLRATKKVRTCTQFSSGTVSVSFAAVQYIKDFFVDLSGKKIILLGTGKIGNHTCKNLVDYLPETSITLINRTLQKAEGLAHQFGLSCRPYEELAAAADEADAVLVATGSHEPVLFSHHFNTDKRRLVIDLSIPNNVDEGVGEVPSLKLVNVDDLSRIKDETLMRRAAEIPKVEAIISEFLNEYLQWQEMRRHAPILQAVKDKLIAIQEQETQVDDNSGARIQKVIKGVALKMRTQNQPGCHYIEAINDFMSPVSAP